MEEKNIAAQQPAETVPELRLKINGSDYTVGIHFSENAFETLDDKLCSLPNPKNPIIASFFRTIGLSDRLGSGVRKLYKYSRYYSGEDPQFLEGDIFRIIVPLNDAYSYDFGQLGENNPDQATQATIQATQATIQATQATIQATQATIQATQANDTACLPEKEQQLLQMIKSFPNYTSTQYSQVSGLPVSSIKYYLRKMKHEGIIRRIGTSQNGFWQIIK